jgi:hypothetical protein
MVFWFVLVCGWGLTAAVIALAWISTRADHRLVSGLLLGALGGLLWPVTFWAAVGAWLYNKASKRAGLAAADPVALLAQVKQADAYAQQAQLEDMPSSADYWRAEARRLAAQHQETSTAISRPAATGLIVVSCTIACLATIGAVMLTVPSSPLPATAYATGSPVLQPPAPRPVDEPSEEPQRTKLGNIAKQYGEVASFGPNLGAPVVEFVVDEPQAAQCNRFAQEPTNGKFVELPIRVTTRDDPENMLVLMTFAAGWEYVGSNGRSVEASTSAAASCGYDAPSQLGPNRTYEFRIVLDVPPEPGVLVLDAVTAQGGWEWAYDSSR